MKDIIKFVPKYSPEQTLKRMIERETKNVPDMVQKMIKVAEVIQKNQYYVSGILKDKFMQKIVKSRNTCECCGRDFKKHNLKKELHHMDYYGKCLRKGGPDCNQCSNQNEKWFRICRKNLCCLCNECHDEISAIQIELWKRNERGNK